MRLFLIFLIFIFLQNCSFDNRSGIWKSESGSFQKDDRIFRDFKKIQSILVDNFKNLQLAPHVVEELVQSHYKRTKK